MTAFSQIQTPVFRDSLTVRVVDPDQVFLLTETRQYVLVGREYGMLARLLDGTRTTDQLLAEVGDRLSLPRAMYALDQMVRKGYVVEGRRNGTAPGVAAWWDSLGVGHDDAHERLASVAVAVDAVGAADRQGLVTALEAAGVRVEEGDGPGTPRIVISDDYLRPDLAEFDRSQRAAGEPWMLAKPVGSVLWLGPVFIPGETACWHCLADRIDGNRQVERYVGRMSRAAEPLVTSRAIAPGPTGYAHNLVATAMEQWVVGGAPPEALVGRLRTHDLVEWKSEVHAVVRRPQCPECGTGELNDPARRPLPVELVARPKTFTGDGGHRASRPEETFERLKHHISPITGVVSSLERLTDDSAELAHSYSAGHNFAMITDDLFFLRRNLRGQSGGKGMTEIQAKVSAVCEAIERWAGVWRGDEARRRATVAEMGDAALPLRSLIHFSDDQYASRKEWNASQPMSRHHLIPEPLPADLEIDWTAAWSLNHERHRWVPSAYAYYGHLDLKRLFFAAPDANGCAAGNTLEEAILQGLMELVERDSTAIWWYNRLPRPELDLDSFDLPYIRKLREYYRGLHREFWALDLTTDLGIPTYAAVSRRTDGRGPEDIVLGLGAHLDPQTAMLRAITELNQFLPAVEHIRPDGSTEYWFPDTDAHQWWRTATIESEPYLLPAPDLPARRRDDLQDLSTADLAQDVRETVDRLARAGIETLVIDQSRPDVDLRVAKVLAPGLRHFWRRLGPGRLYDVPVAMGALDESRSEAEMNTWSIFF